MSDVVPLHNTIQRYDWGSTTAIARLQGRPEADAPEAELWIGDHPAAPSSVLRGDPPTPTPVPALLRDEAARWLGPSRQRHGDRLPFLLKVLAAARPLSLQVHPDRERARERFHPGAPGGPYVDDNHKPEILCALGPFRALHGFRTWDEAGRLLEIAAGGAATLGRLSAAFVADPGGNSMRSLLASLVRADADDRRSLRRELDALVDRSPGRLDPPVLEVLGRLAECYPGDPLVVAPLLLNVTDLTAGEALFTDAGTLHSYVDGTGVELMSTSDNVLRAGLTSKEVHVDELLEVTRFVPEPSRPILPTAPTAVEGSPGSPFSAYRTPVDEFELSVLDWQEPQRAAIARHPEVQVLLCTGGAFRILSGGDELALATGQSVLVRAGGAPWTLEGVGRLFRATVGAAH